MSYFAPYIDDTGLNMPTYEDRLEDLVSAYRSIFGVDAEVSEAVVSDFVGPPISMTADDVVSPQAIKT